MDTRSTTGRLLPDMQRLSIALLAAAAIGLAGCAATRGSGSTEPPSTAVLLSRSPSREVKSAIDRLLPDSLFPPALIGLRVLTAVSREPLYELNPDLLLTPASNQKLLTAAAALESLGPAHRFETVVRIDSSADPSITVTGSGDPLLTTADIDTIAGIVASALPARTEWTLRGDVSAFDDIPWGKGWMWDDEPDPTAMEISPLSVNRNCITVRIRPSLPEGARLIVDLEPETDEVYVVNTGVSTPDSVKSPLTVTRPLRDEGHCINVSGEMRLTDTAVTRRVSIRNPAGHFLALLARRLRSLDVPVAQIRIDTLPAAGDSMVVRSHTMDTVVTFMNRWSDNLSAECLLKTMGRKLVGGRGSGEHGVQAMKIVLARIGVDTLHLVCADGSGASRYNLVSARTVTDVLASIARDTALFPLFLHSLPIAGRSGTLATRMRGTPAQDLIRAKTGTLAGVSALSGYAYSGDGELLAFSILIQNYTGESRRYRSVQDGVAAWLATFRR
jgi:serine-type D-Ala-D-Ala carboxypeptidase/endopeptidase (penicillin-binding protein 4)